MIVWLNGPFGVGKSAVAHALLDREAKWSILDPEERGVELLRASHDVDDFQDLPSWRAQVVEEASLRVAEGDVVIPMTVWRRAYFREILDGLKAAAEVRPFRLTASEATLRERIGRDEVEVGAAGWRLQHLERCIEAFDDSAFGDEVGTEGRTPEKVAHLILVTLGRA